MPKIQMMKKLISDRISIFESGYHQNNLDGGLNLKYVSNDGHFENVYSAKGIPQREANNPQDMGIYNYYGHKKGSALHIAFDVETWQIYRNTDHDKETFYHKLTVINDIMQAE